MMTAEHFLNRLRQELSDLPFAEREAALRYYTEYLAEAGPEHEEEAVDALGSPYDVAQQIRQSGLSGSALSAAKTTAEPAVKHKRFTATLLGKCCIVLVFAVLLLTSCVLLRDLLLSPKETAPTPGAPTPPLISETVSGDGSTLSLPWSENTITNWDIDLPIGYLHIVPGDDYQLELGSKILEHTVCTIDNGTLRMRDPSTQKWWDDLRNAPESDLTITLTYPQTAVLDKVSLSLGIGPSDIKGLRCERFLLDTGVGEILLEDILTGDFILDSGVGEVTGHDLAASRSLSIDSGVGEVELSGDFIGQLTLDSGVGETTLTLARPQSAYHITTDKGIGEIDFDDRSALAPSPALPSTDTENKLSIDNGVGEVVIHFTAEP